MTGSRRPHRTHRTSRPHLTHRVAPTSSRRTAHRPRHHFTA